MILQHDNRTTITTAIRKFYCNKSVGNKAVAQRWTAEKSVNDPKAIFIREQQRQQQ